MAVSIIQSKLALYCSSVRDLATGPHLMKHKVFVGPLQHRVQSSRQTCYLVDLIITKAVRRKCLHRSCHVNVKQG